MDAIILDLIKQADSSDREEQREAILQIAMLLEKHSNAADTSNFYEGIMPAHVSSLVLTEDDRQQVITELGKLIESDNFSPSLLWALGKAKRIEALLLLLTFLNRNCQSLEQEATWQTLSAIENLLILKEDEQIDKRAADLLQAHDLNNCLTSLVNSGDADIKVIAQRILSKITSIVT